MSPFTDRSLVLGHELLVDHVGDHGRPNAVDEPELDLDELRALVWLPATVDDVSGVDGNDAHERCESDGNVD